ncbi:MAG: Asp-tRNA(Asn)/Glu-tRNA(Gln) amidotransferase subunit GatA, partial [Clostridia bacterium]|nr:Asp-tRNA(Asn)/Glu-tRNA(Gln) amidotransferase subunit GatA [Clostridia bacterium]
TSSPKKRDKTFDFLNKDIKGLKIGVPDQFFEGIDSEVEKALNEAIKKYESMGAKVERFDFPEAKCALPVYYVLACAEATSNLARFDGLRYGYKTSNYQNINEMICKTRSEGFGKEVKRRILLGNYVLSSGYYDAYYGKAQKLRGVIIDGFQRIFEKFDVILTPTSPVTAFPMGKDYASPDEAYLADICTVPVNIAGLPAVSVPCGFDAKNLPIGMQIIGNKFCESKILNIAHQFEVYTNYAYNKDLDMGVKI